METRIAHRCLRPKDTVTLGLVGHKSNLSGAKDSHHNPKIYSVIEKRTKTGLVKLAYFQSSRGRFEKFCFV